MDDRDLFAVEGKPGGVVSRKDFIKLAAVTAGLIAAGCTPAWLLKQTPTAIPAGSLNPSYKVALAHVESYDRKLVKQMLQELLEGTGGLAGVVNRGDKVALKVNLTGGLHFNPPHGYSAPESYITHPEIVRSIGELLYDAGAKELMIVEALYDQEPVSAWGYKQMAKDLGASIIDLNTPAPYNDFVRVPVGPGWLIYEYFYLNPILQDIDAFISIAKMKCHYNCGITLSMKNLIGLVPVSKYRLSDDHWWRSALHGAEKETKTRLPRVIVDLNRARPINFALIDGIMTAEGGEAPRGSFRPLRPQLLAAGRNPTALDAVVTAAMGFDPLANPPTPPFLRGDNYLSMSTELGLGTNRLEEIEVAGESLEKIGTPFNPAWEM
jgi:uncharacterized protein (DUF362 family)